MNGDGDDEDLEGPDDLDAYIAERSARDPEFARALEQARQDMKLREAITRANLEPKDTSPN